MLVYAMSDIKFEASFFVRLQISWRWWHRSAWNFAIWYMSVLAILFSFWGQYPQGIPKSWILGL